MALQSLKVKSDAELLSYIINQTPELAAEIDLPTQGKSIAPIGQIIVNNNRYKNAFINALNIIGLTVIDRNNWENPWEGFTNRGNLPYGQTVREVAFDLADVKDYNDYASSATHFLETAVPDMFNYLHELNYQKFYKTTFNDAQLAMAFESGLMNWSEEQFGIMARSYEYDKYIVNKYMLCRRILDGTVTSVEIPDYDTKTTREIVSFMKNISNKMAFMSAKYNPAGLHRATAFGKQITIIDTDVAADIETSVLATSYFRNDAEMKTNMALVDGFSEHDTARLIEVLGAAYVPFTAAEISALQVIPAVIIDDEWFQNYNYSFDTRSEEFHNPETLDNTMWLHTWKVMSTSPFKQACVFTKGVAPAVTDVTINPSEASISAGQQLQLKATVTTTGFANKAVQYSIVEAGGESEEHPVTINAATGLLTIPADYDTSGEDAVIVKATSIFDVTKSAEATITVL